MISFHAEAGVTYSIGVSPYYSNSSGPFELHLQTLNPPPNDNFANAEVLAGLTGETEGTLVDATRERDEPYEGSRTVWFVYTAAETADYEFRVSNHSFYHYLTVYTGSSLSNLEYYRGTSNARLELPLAAGQTIYLCLSAYDTASAYTLSWRRIVRPANDPFGNAFEISGESGSTPGTNFDATTESGEPQHLPGYSSRHSVWWTWTAPITWHYRFRIETENQYNSLAIYRGDSLQALSPVARSTSIGDHDVEFFAEEGQTYHIVVQAYAYEYTGPFELFWSRYNPAPGFSSIDFQTLLKDQAGQSLRPFSIEVWGDDHVTAENGIRIVIPESLPFAFDPAHGSLVIAGEGASRIAPVAQFSEDGKTAILEVTENLTGGTTTTVAGLVTTAPSAMAGPDFLRADFGEGLLVTDKKYKQVNRLNHYGVVRDNEDNARTGNPDNDLGVWMDRYNARSPVEVKVEVLTQPPYTSAYVLVWA